MVERLAHRRGDVVRMRRLDDICSRTGDERPVDVRRVVMRREDDRAQRRRQGRGSAYDLEAVGLTRLCVELERQQPRLVALDSREGVASGRGLQNDARTDPCQDHLDGVEPDRMWIQDDRV